MATTTGRPPLWRDVRVLAWAFQLAVVGLVVAFVLWLLDNSRANSELEQHPDRLRLPRPAGELPDSGE